MTDDEIVAKAMAYYRFMVGEVGYAEGHVQQAIHSALRDVLGTADDPNLDGTDFAHPAWWRGSDEAVVHVVRRFEAAIDGTDTGAGVLGHAGLERVRRWILERR